MTSQYCIVGTREAVDRLARKARPAAASDKLDRQHAGLALPIRHAESGTPCVRGGVGMAVNAVAVGGGVEVGGGLPLRESHRAVSACLHVLSNHNDRVRTMLARHSD